MTRYAGQLELPVCCALLLWDERQELLSVDLFDDQTSAEHKLHQLFEQGALPSAVPAQFKEILTSASRGSGGFLASINLQGTDFQCRVWGAIACIPAGEVRSYSELAAMLGQPTAARAVAVPVRAIRWRCWYLVIAWCQPVVALVSTAGVVR